MIRYFKNYNWPENLEILFMLILGILLQMTDGSPFSIKDRWNLVWDIELPAEYFSLIAQKIIKTIIIMIIMVRCSTTYAYVVSAMLVIFCLLKKTTPKLILPWLSIAGVKSICMTFLEALAGVYVCSAFGKIRKACIEFFISKALEIIFAAYLWGNVLSIYQDMENKARDETNFSSKDVLFSSFGRQRARSLLDESTLYKTACLNNFEFKDVPQIILQMLKRDDEMSQDSLLGPGMMLASVSNLGSFDNLKTSQSLGELGFTDLGSTQVVGLEEDENLSHREKVLKFLKLTKSDIARIRLNKCSVENDIYTVDDNIWARVIASGTHINKPKQARTEIFIREIPQPEETTLKAENSRKLDMKFNFTFSNLLIGKQCDFQDYQEDKSEEDSLILSQDEEEGKDDEEVFRLFMSNIKEGVVINRYGLGFGLKTMKGNEYEELYKQDFMSEIGPEVFERATNLPKVTSFTKIVRNSVSLPEIKELLQTGRKKNISQENSSEEVEQISNLNLYSRDQEYCKKQNFSVESLSREKIGKIMKKNSIEDKIMRDNLSQIVSQMEENDSMKQAEDQKLKCETTANCLDENELSEIKHNSCLPSDNPSIGDIKEAKPCFRKRRILIKRKGKQKTSECQKFLFGSWCSPKNSGSGSEQKITSRVHFNKEDGENLRESKMFSNQENNLQNSFNDKKLSSVKVSQMYFLTEMLEKPNWEVSITYYDLSKKMQLEEKAGLWSQKLSFLNSQINNYRYKLKKEQLQKKMLDSMETSPKEEKVWKSNVLNTVETSFMPKYSHAFRPSLKNKLETKYLRSPQKTESLLDKKDDTYSSRSDGKNDDTLISHNLKSTSFGIVEDFENENDNDLKMGNEDCLNLKINSKTTESILSLHNKSEDSKKISTFSTTETVHEKTNGEFVRRKSSNLMVESKDNFQSFRDGNLKNDSDEGAKTETEVDVNDLDVKNKLNLVTSFETLVKEDSFSSQESDEPISLYYSKAADLASPLLDMKRFIYPDHIHYSYKHVNKKGFDIDINGGFPLLVRENLSINSPLNAINESTSRNPEPEIKRRPMDLSFATTNAFADWQSSYSNDIETKQSQEAESSFSAKKDVESLDADFVNNTKKNKTRCSKKMNEKKDSRITNGVPKSKLKPKPHGKNFNDFTFMYSAKDYILIEKLLRMHLQFNKNENSDFESRTNKRAPIQISSTQLHSNKGRKNSIKNPAIFLQKNKTRNEKKKIETQEERTKDMFARLAREAFLQNSNAYTSSGLKRNF